MRRKLPAIIWLIILVVISGYPGDKVPEVPIWQFDKMVHAVVYFVLSLLLILAYSKQYQLKDKRFAIGLYIFLFGISFGGVMEILQHYIFINRSGNWYDFLANGFGALCGVLSQPFVIKLLPKISCSKN